MAENLNIGHMKFYQQGSGSTSNDGIIQKYCYDNIISNCNTYGGMYEWPEMMNYNPSDTGMTGTTQGIYMDGWHIPSCDEWETLFYFLGGYKLQLPTGYTVYKGVGGKLKDTGPLWDQPNYGATNESGFSALPTGVFSGYGFDRKNMDAFWWSSMSYFNLALDFATTDIGVGTSSVDGVSAVRCIKDPPKK